MKLKDVMTIDVECCQTTSDVIEAAAMMKDYNVGSIPICENDRVVGVVTDRDIAIRVVAEHKHHATLKDIMTNELITGNPDMSVEEAIELMENKQIRRLPVTAGDRLVGIVSLGDLAVEGLSDSKAGEALSQISSH